MGVFDGSFESGSLFPDRDDPATSREFNHKMRVTALADLLISYDITPEVAVEKAEKFLTFMEIDLCPLKKSSPPSSW